MTDENYGKRIGLALQAIKLMHSDTSRLLRDCDGTIGKGMDPVFKNNATRDLTYHVEAEYWMADGVYRLFDAKRIEPGLVQGVVATFFHNNLENCDEPILIVGQIKYAPSPSDVSNKKTIEAWDLWRAFFEWSSNKEHNKVLQSQNHPDRIVWVKLIAVPLFSVTSIEVVEDLMAQVTTERIQTSTQAPSH